MKTFLLTATALFLALLYGTGNAQTCVQADLSHPLTATTVWADNSSDETGFVLERSLNGGAFTALAPIAANVTQVTDATVVRSQAPAVANTYTYRVKAVKTGSPDSTYSNTACITFTPTPALVAPTAPSGFTVSQNTASPSDTLSLTWDDLSNETSYEIFGRPANGPKTFVKLASVAQDTTNWDWTGLTAHKSYCNRVRGVNTKGAGPFTPIACNTTSR